MQEGIKLRRSIYYTLAFVALIWGIKIIEFSFGYNFGQFGILPRTLSGSVGIFTAPLIHGDIYHLLSNTLPITILGVGLFYFYDKIALWVVLLIYLITGFWVWIAARDAYHIGASGVVYGLLTFLLFSGFFRRDSSTLAISFIVLFLYGGTFLTGMIPENSGISWESHLMGAIAGVFCAVYFRNYKIGALVKQEQEEDQPAANQLGQYTYHYKPKSVEPDSEVPKEQRYIIKYHLHQENK
ncbi:rhomboid family intramembrane serine protease [Fulvivirga sp. 29W222]|uniref:Rhomboid family intramembrane serine protease n=1 Tax=Fulvivirga marina TaxID=2494733 RepID=A0A937G1C8_9BACT|nr:rhomboid family intramembrane serine protease [Fulvivirga marina]MBL6449995.1 rhomboid family intramembrane serine protease [Fulvivirga marina]